MEPIEILAFLFIINLALAQLPYITKKVCINQSCQDVLVPNPKLLYGKDIELKQNVLKILAIIGFIAFLALIFYLVFKLVS